MSARPTLEMRRALPLIAFAASLSFAGAAWSAQYQWRDGQGRMVYSDLPPPASIAPRQIISAPATATVAPGMTKPDSANAGSPASVVAGQAHADRELAYRKRQAEQAEQEKKSLEASRRKAELAQACADSQGEIRSLASGQRIGLIDAAGERAFLSDEDRAQRLKVARKNVGEHC